MDTSSFNILEYDAIKAQVRELCVSNLGKTLCDRLEPRSDASRVRVALTETTEARQFVKGGAQPIQALHDISEPLTLAEKGQVLAPKDLLRIADTMRGASKFKKVMRSRKEEAPLLASYAESIADLPELIQTIEGSVDGERVSDGADEDLRKVRRNMKQVEAKIQSRLQGLMASASLRDVIQEGFVTVKNGRYVIPVKASQKAHLPGTVVAASSSGQTVFVEPATVQPLVNELVSLQAEEEDLVYKVLCALTEQVLDRAREIRVSVEAMAACDFALAKGRYSLEVGGVEPSMGGGTVRLVKARHPLLGKEAVPVDVTVGGRERTLVVTGPNTGGKTVLLKTVGLLCLMAQSGLHVPAAEAALPMLGEVLADIGDRQSIQQSLSTFSSHMSNIARILSLAGPGSLVLLDEIGTGTDPREGAALACSVLDFLFRSACITVATTHYGDVKVYSENHRGFVNGCVEFDEETLKPLYRLVIGRSGKSQGIVIAERLGLPADIISQARRLAGQAESSPASNDAAERVVASETEERREAFEREASAAPDVPATPVRSRPDASAKEPPPPLPREMQFLLGDSVFVTSVNDKGLVAREADERGDLIVLVRDERVKVNRKRLKMLIKREDLYPDWPDYDLRIVLATKADRKIDKAMSRKMVEGVRVIEPDPE